MILSLGNMRLALLCALIWGLFGGWSAGGAAAQPYPEHQPSLNIPAQNADDAVKALARAHGRSVLFQTDDVMAVTTKPLQGKFSLQRALNDMFEGTTLQGGLTESGAIIVSQRKVDNTSGGTEPMQKKRSGFFLTTALSSLAATAAIGQDTTPASENEDVIIVVGSQIRGADIAGALPVTVLDVDDIETTGAVNGEELFSSIPQVGGVLFNGSRFVGVNGARGDVSSIDLRSIGTGNTLVLLNGRRMVLHPGTQVENLVPVQSVNTNAIPVTGVSRIEVLRDGAAALYGTDAVAGVVNTVLKDDFEGLTTNIQYGASEGTSLWELSASFEAGITFNEGRTNISVFGNFLEREGMPASDLRNSSTEDLRDFFVGTPFEGDTQLRNTSTAAQFGEFRALGGNIDAIGDNDFHIQPETLDGCLVSLPGGVCADDGGTIDAALRLDRSGFRDIVGDTTRGTVFAFLNHDFDNGIEFFGEASYYRADFQRQREQANVLSSNRIVIPSTAFYNPFGDDIQIRDLRPLDAGPREVDVDNTSFRILGGLRGQWRDWDWETAGLYTEAETDDTTTRISNTLFQEAIARTTPDAYNPFSGGNITDTNAPNLSANSPETIDSFIVPVSRISTTTLALADVKASNPAVFSWFAGDIGAAIGAEWRRESFEDDRDDRLDGTITFTDIVTGETNLSDVLGSSNTPDTDGDRNVYSVFIETAIPLVEPEMNIPLVETFDVQLSARFESFSDVGEVIKPKVAFSWYPASWLQVRGAYARGFRAPNLEQINATGIRRVNTNREDWILCEATARANGTDFNAGQCDGVSIESVRAGGPDLQPENNVNMSIGAVFQPTNNLTFTLDFWKIEQTDVVGIFGDQDQITLDYLLRVQGSSNPNVIREAPDAETIALYEAAGLDPAGEIIEVVDNFTNLNPREASGIDIGAFYDIETANAGDFNFKVNAAYLGKFFQTPGPDSAAIIEAVENGMISDEVDVGGIESLLEQNGRPRWRGSASFRWSKGPFGFGAFGQYVGPFTDTSVTGPDGEIFRVDDFITVNLHVDYTIEDAGLASDTRLRFGVRNVGDVLPPLADEFATGYFSGLHSNRGRYWYGSIRKSF